MSAASPRIVDAAAAVLIRPDGAFLLAQRPPEKVYGGWWEFPGGKIEAGETAREALARELHEELGVDPVIAHPWITRVFAYEHATVRLHFFRVYEWRGEPHGREGQAFEWQRAEATTVGPVLPANGPVLKALALPEVYAISNAEEVGAERFLAALAARLAGGLRLVQVRDKTLARDRRLALASAVVALARPHGAAVLVNDDAALAAEVGASGVHLSAAALRELDRRPQCTWVGASVHDAGELRKAEAAGCDFAVLGPVRPTATHPGTAPLGWGGFAAVVADAAIPVLAIGGLVHGDVATARSHGGHGVAMIRGAWTG